MSLIAKELQDVWDALGAGNGHRDDALAGSCPGCGFRKI